MEYSKRHCLSTQTKRKLEIIFIESYLSAHDLHICNQCTQYIEISNFELDPYCILVENHPSKDYLINLNQTYSPIVVPHRTSQLYTEFSFDLKVSRFFSYCILQPINLDDFINLDQINNFKISVFRYSKNWKAYFNSSHDYWSKRPTKLLNTIKRKTKKCLDFGLHFDFFNSLDMKLIDNYWDVYNKSWKPVEKDKKFIETLLKKSSNNNNLRLGFAYHNSLAIAFCFWIVIDKTAFIVKLAQNNSYNHLSPGTVLMAKMINWTCEVDHIQKIDFLTGDDLYKKDWMDTSAELYGLEIFNMKTIRGRLLWYRHCIIRFLKSIRSRFNKHE